MALTNTAAYLAKLKDKVLSWRTLLYIKDTNDKWVDFTDRTELNGKDLLADIGRVSLVAEKKDGTGLTSSKPMTVRLNNSKRFFNDIFPSSLKTIDGSTASFNSSENAKHSVLFNSEVQLRISIVFKNSSNEEGILSTYIAGNLKTSYLSPFAELELKDKSLPLREDDSGEAVKNGLNYHANKPIKFLIEEGLKVRYRQSDGNLPSGFIIPDKVEIQSQGALAGESGDQRVLSHFGRMPEQDQTGTWLNKGLVCRSVDLGFHPSLLQTGSSPPANPFSTETILYMGCDDELWYWDETTELATLAGTVASGKIRRLWFSGHQQKIYGVSYDIKTAATIGGLAARTASVVLFKYDGTSITTIATLTDVYIAEFCYRDGRSVSGSRSVGQDTGRLSGENIPVVYPHTVIPMKLPVLDKGDGYRKSTTLMGAVDLTSPDARLPVPLDSGYYATRSDGTTGNSHLRYSLGQKGFFVMNSRATNDIYLWYSIYDSVNEETDIKRINLQTGSDATIKTPFEVSAGERIDPTCGCVDEASSSIYIGGVYWDDSGGVDSEGYICKMTSGGTQTKLYNADDHAASQRYFTPLEMIHESDVIDKLTISFFARDRLDKHNAFAIATHGGVSNGDVTVINERRTQLKGFVYARSVLDEGSIFAYEISTGEIYKINMSANTLTVEDEGFPSVDNEFNLAISELVLDGDSRTGDYADIIYGISSPVPLPTEAYISIPSGKFYLFKLDSFYSGRVPLAKTEGMSIWKFIELLAQMSGYKTGFNRNGDFYFLPNTLESTSDFTFDFSDPESRGIDLILSEGQPEIYNVVRIVPHSVFLSPAVEELKLVTREIINETSGQTATAETPFDSDIFISQKDDRTKTIRMDCVRGGRIAANTAAFRYRSIDEIFETRLAADYTASATTLRITGGIDSAKAGDTIKVGGGGNEETGTVLSDPTNSEKNTGTVNLLSGFSNSYSRDDFIQITNNLSEWSDERVNPVVDGLFQNWTADDLDDWTESDGNIDASEDTSVFLYSNSTAKLTLSGGTDSYIYQDIASTKFVAATKYTVSAFLKGFAGDGSNAVSEVELKITGAGVSVTATNSTTSTNFVKVSATFTTTNPTGTVRVEIHVKGTDVSEGWVDGVVLKQGLSADLDLLVVSNNQFMPIGNSNVEIKFVPQTNETKLFIGDQVIIKCHGLDLKKDTNSTLTYIDTTSRARHGEKTYPKIENPFLGRGLSRDIGKRILTNFSLPKYLLKLVSTIAPDIDFVTSGEKITSIDVRNKELFKKSPGWKERAAVNGIEDDLRSGLSFISLKAVNKE